MAAVPSCYMQTAATSLELLLVPRSGFVLLNELLCQPCWIIRLGVEFVKRPDDGKMKGLAFIKDPDGYWIEILNPDTSKNFQG